MEGAGRKCGKGTMGLCPSAHMEETEHEHEWSPFPKARRPDFWFSYTNVLKF